MNMIIIIVNYYYDAVIFLDIFMKIYEFLGDCCYYYTDWTVFFDGVGEGLKTQKQRVNLYFYLLYSKYHDIKILLFV